MGGRSSGRAPRPGRPCCPSWSGRSASSARSRASSARRLQRHVIEKSCSRNKNMEPRISIGKMADMIHDPPIFSARRAPPRHRVRRRAEARGCEDGSAQPSNVGCKNVESPPSSIAKISLENAVQLSPRRTPLRVQLLSVRFLFASGRDERARLWFQLRSVRSPVTCAIHGSVVGGGVAASLLTDHITAEQACLIEHGTRSLYSAAHPVGCRL